MRKVLFLILYAMIEGGSMFGTTMPPGKYIVVDPCYVLSEENYDKLMNSMYHVQAGHEVSDPVIDVEFNGHKALIMHTRWGDGTYPLKNSKTGERYEVPVDSGTIGLFRVDAVDKMPQWCGGIYKLAKIEMTHPFEVEVDHDYNMTFGFWSVTTDEGAEEDYNGHDDYGCFYNGSDEDEGEEDEI